MARDIHGNGAPVLLVGASGDSAAGLSSGAVHRLVLNTDYAVTDSKRIDTFNNGPLRIVGQSFGAAVAGVGDLDGDGTHDLAVGDSSDGTTGVLHVLLLNSRAFIRDSIEIGHNTNGGPTLASGDRFGVSVASLGDINGDGIVDIAVGADGDDTGGTDRGAVHVLFMNSDGTVKHSTHVAHALHGGPLLNDGDRFGSSVTALGDLNGDGIPDMAVGAHLDDTNGTDRGAVYVLLMASDGSAREFTKIVASTNGGPDVSDGALFGTSVASTGDVNGDGINDLAVGAPQDRGNGRIAPGQQGAVYIVFLNAAGSATETTLIASTRSRFGSSLAGMGDLDGDGRLELAVGIPRSGIPRFSAGAVHLLQLNANGTVADTSVIAGGNNGAPVLTSFIDFGRSLTPIGDWNGDGVADIAVGARHHREFRGALHLLFMNDPADDVPITLELPMSGTYEILQDESDLVVRVADGPEVMRQNTATVSVLNIHGSKDADTVSVVSTDASVSIPLVFRGGGGDDRFNASWTRYPVRLFGNGGNDVLIGGTGDDTLSGGSGKDRLTGGRGNDVLRGQGTTGDSLLGGPGDDVLNGGSGNDVIVESFTGDLKLTSTEMTGQGNDRVLSTERAILTGSKWADRVDTSEFFTPRLTSVTLDGGAGNDSLIGTSGSDLIVGARGEDWIDAGPGNDRVFGGAGNDSLIGKSGNDLIVGARGEDWIDAGPGNDRLFGGDGRDTLVGGTGVDTVDGGPGVDRWIDTVVGDVVLTSSTLPGLNPNSGVEIIVINGDDSANVIDISGVDASGVLLRVRGNGGDDLIIGSPRGDILLGGEGNDTLLGKGGNDTLRGGGGADRLSGHDGNDRIEGGDFHDIAYGGNGYDGIYGQRGVDILIGGDGFDFLAGGNGHDTLVSGTGNDDASWRDTITDAGATIDELFTIDPLPGWVDQV